MVDIDAPGGSGANDGYWMLQLRDRFGRFMEMGGGVLFEVNLPGVDGVVYAKGTFIGATDMTTARIDVPDNSEIPRGVYLIKTDKIENIQAVIPPEYLKNQLAKSKPSPEPLKKSMVGAEVQKKKLKSIAKNLKTRGRFPVPRQSMNDTMGKTSDVTIAAKADYKQVYDASPQLQERYKGPGELWNRVYSLSVDTDWSSPNELSEIPEEMRLINREYAKHFLGLEEDGLITVYRNAVGGKNSQVDAAAGYVSTDMSFAYDYNSKSQNIGANGRYEIDVKPDEVFGMLGYSKPEDEFAFVIGKGVTSQEGRVRRVGDVAPLPMPAPWLNEYEKEISYASGATPYRHHALGGQFNFHEVDNFGDNVEEFFSKYNLTSADIKSKFDELYGSGAYDEYKASEGTISFNTIRRMFVDLPNGKIGLDITKIQGGRDGVLTMARYGDGGPDTFKNDRTDTTLKMMSVFQELTGQPFFTHRSRDYVPGAESSSEEKKVEQGAASIFEGALDEKVFDISKLGDKRHYAEDPEMFKPEEVTAIKQYTGSSAFKIWNKALRNNDTEKLPEIKNDIKLLDAIIADHGEVYTPARVFRGLVISEKSSVNWKNIMENLSIGDTLLDEGYVSTSNSPEVAYGNFGGGIGGKLLTEDGEFGGSRYMSNNALLQGSVFWSIDLPVGSKAFGVPEGMGHQGEAEDEVILPRGSSVVVKSIRKVQHVDADGNPIEDAFNYFLETELVPQGAPEVVDAVDKPKDSGVEQAILDSLPTQETATEEQARAVARYTHQAHDSINNYLRYIGGDSKVSNPVIDYSSFDGGKYVLNKWASDEFAYTLDEVLEYIESLDALIEQAPGIVEDTTLYRYLQDWMLSGKLLKTLKPGDEMEDKGFISTSRGNFKPSGDSNLKMIINVPKGTKGLYVDWFKGGSFSDSGEQEVLLPRGTKFVVTKIEDNQVYVDIKESSDSGEPEVADVPIVEEAEDSRERGPGIWGRLKLRELKDRINYVLSDDPELQNVINQYSVSDESVDKLEEVLREMGAFRKALIAEPLPRFISAAEKEYSKIDPNLDTKTGIAPSTPSGDIPDTGLGTTGYIVPQLVIEAIENMIMPNSLGDIDMEEITKNGFTSPVVLLYNEETNKFTLKNPEIDSNRLLTARYLKRLAPTVVEIGGKSQNPRFSAFTTPKDFRPTSPLPEEDYPDISGIPDLPTPERSQAEKDAIQAYRGWGYLDVKNHMETPYGDPNKTEEERKKLDEIVENLDRVTKEPIPKGTVLYRGFELYGAENKEWYEYFSEVEAGDSLMMPIRVTSTTLDIAVAESFAAKGGASKTEPKDMKAVVLKIVAGDDATGAVFENDKTVFSREKEVLLPGLANVNVTKAYKDSDGVIRIEGVYETKKSQTVDVPIVDEVKDSETENIPVYKTENNKTGWKYSDEHVVGTGGKDSPTDEELDAIATYIGNGYSQMNDVTRGYDPGDDPFSKEDIDTYVENLTNLIDRNPPLGTTALVYRGVYDSVGMKWSELEVGNRFVDNGFISTSPHDVTASGFGNIQLEIELGEDTKAIDVSETVGGTRVPVKEREIILQRGTAFEVVAKTDKGFRLRVVDSAEDLSVEDSAESEDFYIKDPADGAPKKVTFGYERAKVAGFDEDAILVTAFLGDRKLPIGNLHLDYKTRMVKDITVSEDYQRKGVATELWKYAQKQGLEPKHSPLKTAEGEKWAESLKEDTDIAGVIDVVSEEAAEKRKEGDKNG